MTKLVKMILDTDIGTDVDDALALALVLNSPEIELLAVSTVSVQASLRAQLAAKILRTWGREDIPIAPGKGETFDGSPTHARPVNQAAALEAGDPTPRGEGVELIIKTIHSHPGKVVLTAIGPLTNVATAFAQAPDLAERVQRLVIMGGSLQHEVKLEYNISCDPAAAAYVFNLPTEKILVPLDVTMRCRYRQENHAALQQMDNSRTRLIWAMIQAWQVATGRVEPILHDPLAVAVAFMPDLVTLKPMCLTVATKAKGSVEPGQLVERPGEPNLQVAVDIDVERFEGLFADRIA